MAAIHTFDFEHPGDHILAFPEKSRPRYRFMFDCEPLHGRWGIEELFKAGMRIFAIEDFHCTTERGVNALP
jgi:hypothetical protein